MSEAERDSTQDWVLPAASRPPTMRELGQRVDHALAVARASEAAAIEIGAAALDAAEQARRAAELAERASGGRSGPPANGNGHPAPDLERESVVEEPVAASVPVAAPEPADEALKHFSERADRVMARLRALELPERVG